MSERRPSATAASSRRMVERHRVAHVGVAHVRVANVRTDNDRLADHVARLADSDVELDDAGQMPIARRRAGQLDRTDRARLEASHLRETQL